MTTLTLTAGLIALVFALYILIEVILPRASKRVASSDHQTYLDPTRTDTDEIAALRAELTKYRNAATPRGKAEAPVKIAALGTQIDTAKGYVETVGYGHVEPIEGSWMLSNDPQIMRAGADDLTNMARVAREILATTNGLSDTEIDRLTDFAHEHPEPVVTEARRVSTPKRRGIDLSKSGKSESGPAMQRIHTLEADLGPMSADMLIGYLRGFELDYGMSLVGFSFQSARAIFEGSLTHPSESQAYRRSVAFDAIREHFEPKPVIERCTVCQAQILREHREAHLATHGHGRTTEVKPVMVETMVSLAHAQIMPETKPVAQIEGSLHERTVETQVADLDTTEQPYPYEAVIR